jgi:ribosomal protein S12 methylthiotransferase
MTAPSSFFLLRLGCPKNDADAENMAGHLQAAGLRAEEDPARADVLIVNTCGFIGDAKAESIDAVLGLAGDRRPDQRLVVASCLVQRYGDELARELPEVDAFLGSGEADRIVEAATGGPRRALASADAVYLAGPETPRACLDAAHVRYVKIADGCDRRCAFCAIPLFKGRQRSRPPREVAVEVRRLAAEGAREIVLVAQDTTAFGADDGGRSRLPELLDLLEEVRGYDWLRLLYLYPDRVDDALLQRFARHERLLPYFDVPFQHVSDRILARMRRGTSRQAIERVIADIRAALPGAVIRTSLIVGFPGETRAELEELLDFLEAQGLDNVGAFVYSEEDGTHALTLDGVVPEEERQARRDELMALQMDISRERLARYVGQTLPVLIDRVDEGGAVGRFFGQAPEIDGLVNVRPREALAPGDLVDVLIEDANEYDLFGREV